MSARLPLFAALATVTAILSGCDSSKRLYSAEREEGRVAALDWYVGERIEASKLDEKGNPPLSQSDAASLANEALPNFVKHPERWSLGYIRLVELKAGRFAWAVRFDRKGVFDDEQASDKFVKFHVLFDRSVVVPTMMYDR